MALILLSTKAYIMVGNIYVHLKEDEQDKVVRNKENVEISPHPSGSPLAQTGVWDGPTYPHICHLGYPVKRGQTLGENNSQGQTLWSCRREGDS